MLMIGQRMAEGTKPNRGSGLIGTYVIQTGRQILWQDKIKGSG